MKSVPYDMTALFQQLGLDCDEQAIEDFIKAHSPLHKNTKLENASFWNISQAQLLHQLIEENADWANVVEQLNTRMH